MHVMFTREEIAVAAEIQLLVITGELQFVNMTEEESLFIVDVENYPMSFFDISKTKKPNSVSLRLKTYEMIMFKHVLIHNHPRTHCFPSYGDYDFDAWLRQNFGQQLLMFQMTIDDRFKAALFRSRRGSFAGNRIWYNDVFFL